MRKRHRRKAQFLICACQNTFVQSQRTPDYKLDLTVSLYSQLFYSSGQLHGIHAFPVNRQRNNVGIRPDLRQQTFSFFLANGILLRLARPIRRLFIGNLQDFQLTIPAQSLAIFFDCPPKVGLFYLSHATNTDFHASVLLPYSFLYSKLLSQCFPSITSINVRSNIRVLFHGFRIIPSTASACPTV